MESDDPTVRDFLGFGRAPLSVDAEDLATLQAGLEALLVPYLTERGGDRRRVSLTTVLMPQE